MSLELLAHALQAYSGIMLPNDRSVGQFRHRDMIEILEIGVLGPKEEPVVVGKDAGLDLGIVLQHRKDRGVDIVGFQHALEGLAGIDAALHPARWVLLPQRRSRSEEHS